MASDEQPVLLRNDGAVAHIRFNRPQVLNALNAECAYALLAACKAVAADKNNRVVVISGEGRAFMAGGDIGSFSKGMAGNSEFFHELIGVFHEAMEILASLPRPVVASLNGAVAGAGLSVAMIADLAIAADDAKFTLAYSRLGTSPDGSSSWSLPRIVGTRKALEIAMLSDVFDAQEAQRLGIVNKVVPAAALAEETEKLARRLADGPTFAYGNIKQLIRQSHLNTLHDQLAKEGDAFVRCSQTEDFAEGVAAFIGKRAPKFSGA
jgi:2-(1,2-epoxy-1,2-dihydrophenyl)acetyl-CoA isomerase